MAGHRAVLIVAADRVPVDHHHIADIRPEIEKRPGTTIPRIDEMFWIAIDLLDDLVNAPKSGDGVPRAVIENVVTSKIWRVPVLCHLLGTLFRRKQKQAFTVACWRCAAIPALAANKLQALAVAHAYARELVGGGYP